MGQGTATEPPLATYKVCNSFQELTLFHDKAHHDDAIKVAHRRRIVFRRTKHER